MKYTMKFVPKRVEDSLWQAIPSNMPAQLGLNADKAGLQGLKKQSVRLPRDKR